MSSEERIRDWISDIIENCDRIALYLKDRDFKTFSTDGLTRDAVERCLERIIEAAVRIGPDRLAQIAPETILHEVRGLGNILRHEYDRVNTRLIWKTAASDLPRLKAACEAAL